MITVRLLQMLEFLFISFYSYFTYNYAAFLFCVIIWREFGPED